MSPKKKYGSDLVEMWADFIDWQKRRKGENGFLKNTLEKNNAIAIFDSCLGDGCDSIYLIKEGFEVTSNDLDPGFIKKAQENARKENVKLHVTSFDWRKLDKHFEKEKFDAVLCVGNSLTHLFKLTDRTKTLWQFHRLLKENGILIIDERNYQYILDNKKEILGGKFRYKRKYVYCGSTVHGYPIKIANNKVVMEYNDTIRKKKAQLALYPFKKNELLKLLEKTGFRKITQYSDYKKGFDEKADFYTYVCVK